MFRHLTNASVNKHNPQAREEREGIEGTGCKFVWDQFHEHVRDSGVDPDRVWARIKLLVSYCCLCAARSVPQDRVCFELFGFDVMVDDSGRPWILEVNFSPDLIIEGGPDQRVKPALVSAIFDTLRMPTDGWAPAGQGAPADGLEGDAPVEGSGLELVFPFDAATERISRALAGPEGQWVDALKEGLGALQDAWEAVDPERTAVSPSP